MRLGRRAHPSAATLAFLSLSVDAAAADPPGDTQTLPCRPTIACTADFVRPGALEVEAGVLFRRLGGSDRQWSFPFLVKLTATSWFQLQVGSSGLTLGRGDLPAAFFDDAEIGAKFHLVDQSEIRPALAIAATIGVPTFEPDALRTVDAQLTVFATKDFGPLHADLNGGANLLRLEGAPAPQAFVALALSASLPAPFGVMAEAYYFSDAPPLAPRDGGFLFALTVSPRRWLTFDFGGDVGWFPSARAYSTFFGMSIVPVLLWTDRATTAPRRGDATARTSPSPSPRR